MRIVFVTQQVDPDHPILGATVAKIAALAHRCDEVVVFADGAVPGVLPVNCRVRSFHSRSRLGRGARYVSQLTRELLRRPRPDALVAHMCPIYAVLAWPLARPLGVRRVLWYTHWHRTRLLELAERLVDAIASVDALSVPLPSRKVVGIGHGIETGPAPARREGSSDGGLELVALGRYSEAKGLRTIVRGVAAARARGVAVCLRCHGPTAVPAEVEERALLGRLVDEAGVAAAVELGGPVPRGAVPDLLASADALVNNMREGAADKAVFEAGAAGLPIVFSNRSFDALADGLGARLRFDRDDPDDLADVIEGLAALGPAGRRELGAEIARRVVAGHSVGTWADRMLEVCAGPDAGS